MGTPILGEIFETAKTIIVQLGTWLKDIFKFIFSNFPVDNYQKLLLLSVILFIMVTVFIAAFIGARINGTMGDLKVGSGAVMSDTSKFGSLTKKDSAVQITPDTTPITIPTNNDLDNDGIPNGEDGDMDGDGIPNGEDGDIDGDGIPNHNDPTPGAGTGIDSILVHPCGDGICETIDLTRDFNVGFIPLAYRPTEIECPPDNPTPVIVHNVPWFCMGYSVDGRVFTSLTWRVQYTSHDRTVFDAACGIEYTQPLLSNRCIIDANNYTLWYVENAINCPADCNTSEYPCYADLTCDFNPDNCEQYPDLNVCCPSETLLEDRCIPTYPSGIDNCNDPGINFLWGRTPLNQLRYTSYHCPCNTGNDCINDHSAPPELITCCPADTLHEGFCYHVDLCDT